MEVTKNKEISRRVLYSLKLSLRMLNAQFSDFKIYQVNSSSLSFDQKFKDKITLESWYKPNSRQLSGVGNAGANGSGGGNVGGGNGGSGGPDGDNDEIAQIA
jgi:uncharacterized membrane protein